MSDAKDSDEKRLGSPMRSAMDQRVKPVAIVGISIYIPAFLSLVIFAQTHQESWFVKTFLGGFGIAIAGIVLLGAMMAITSLYEGRIQKRKADDKRGSDSI